METSFITFTKQPRCTKEGLAGAFDALGSGAHERHGLVDVELRQQGLQT